MVDLVTVVVTHNVRDLLRGCLSSIEQSATSLKHEVWVVDNGSTDGTSPMVRQEFPWVNLIDSDNVGFSRGNNLALRRVLARAEETGLPRFVLLLNPDTELPPTALTDMPKGSSTTPFRVSRCVRSRAPGP